MSTPVLVAAGTAPFGSGRNGDYSSTAIDPTNGTFWAGSEFATPQVGNVTNNWGTWIANFATDTATHLAVGASAGIVAGSPTGLTITALDAFNKSAVGYLGTVHFSSTDAQAGLPSDYTFTAADGGVHAFSATLKTAGAYTVTAADAANGLSGTAGVTVAPAAASTLTVVGLPSSATAGTALGFTVTMADAYGNVAVGYAGTVHFSSTDAQAGLPSDYSFTAADGGVHAFSATLKTAGARSLAVSDAANGLSGTAGVTVAPAAASTLAVVGLPSSATAGTAAPFTITALDAYGNVNPSYAGTVHFSSTDTQASLPSDYTFTAADGGVHAFSATLKTAGAAHDLGGRRRERAVGHVGADGRACGGLHAHGRRPAVVGDGGCRAGLHGDDGGRLRQCRHLLRRDGAFQLHRHASFAAVGLHLHGGRRRRPRVLRHAQDGRGAAPWPCPTPRTGCRVLRACPSRPRPPHRSRSPPRPRRRRVSRWASR